MNVNDLIFSMKCGEEIEIEICGKLYFLQPDYENCNESWLGDIPPYPYTVIFDCADCENPKRIFVGSAEEVVSYQFENKYTIKSDFEKIKIG